VTPKIQEVLLELAKFEYNGNIHRNTQDNSKENVAE
jgi:hypothetical protein